MTEDQFRQVVGNRRPWQASPLFGGDDELGAKVVRSAAESALRMRQAQAAWRRAAADAWLEHTEVSSVRDGIVTIATGSASVRFELLRQKERVRGVLASSIPGFRDWVVVFGEPSAERGDDERYRDRRGKTGG